MKKRGNTVEKSEGSLHPDQEQVWIGANSGSWGAYASAALSGVAGIGLVANLWYGDPDAASVVISLPALLLVVMSLLSCAYATFGECTVVKGSREWIVESRLGRWGRTRRLFLADAVSADLYRTPRANVPFPSIAGWCIRVELRNARTFILGAGLNQPRETLAELLAELEADIASAAATADAHSQDGK